jgi:hypothetical protein
MFINGTFIGFSMPICASLLTELPFMDGIRLLVRYLSGIGIHYDEVVEHIEYIDIPHVNLPEWVRFLRFASSLDNLTLLFHLLQDHFSSVYCR